MVHAARGCERAGVMEITAFESHDHQHNAGSGVVAYAGSPASAGRDDVTVAPTGAIPGARGLRVQGMPWRRWLTTTPGRLRSASALLVIGLLVFAAVTTAATEARSRAAGAVATTSAPELITAENLYGNLADADATASTIFLRAGQEPRQLRRRYLADVAAAGRQLADFSRSAQSSPAAHRAVRTISERLPEYTGLVESARANNAQGFPVGAAYLRKASATMHNEILPAATDLYRDAASELRDNYEAGTSTLTLVLVLVAGVGMLALLVVVQIFVRRRSNRLLNLGLVAATVLVVGLLGWTLVRFAGAHDALNRAQERGSDSVEVLSSARILTLRAQNNENLALIERGTGDVYVAEFDRLMGQLGGRDGKAGLLGYAATIADRTGDGSRIRALAPQFTALRKLHSQVRHKDDGGDYNQAVALSIGTSDSKQVATLGPGGPGQELTAVDKLQHALQHDIARSQVRLASAAQDARTGYGVLEVAIPLFAVLAGLLVLLGLERRIGEYR
jgi:hypothetical protein